MHVESLAGDGRRTMINVAGSAALLVAKLHKLGERVDTPNRLNDKDAHDVYRLLVATSTDDLAATMQMLQDQQMTREVVTHAMGYLRDLFSTADALGASMAGRAEAGIGQPDTVAASVSYLAQDLLAAMA